MTKEKVENLNLFEEVVEMVENPNLLPNGKRKSGKRDAGEKPKRKRGELPQTWAAVPESWMERKQGGTE